MAIIGVRFPQSSQFGVRTKIKFVGLKSQDGILPIFSGKAETAPFNRGQDGSVKERLGEANGANTNINVHCTIVKLLVILLGFINKICEKNTNKQRTKIILIFFLTNNFSFHLLSNTDLSHININSSGNS